MASECNKIILSVLNKCDIVCENIDKLDGLLIPRDILLSDDKYNSVNDELIKLRDMFSKSYMNSLQLNAEENQKWPLLNLVRQLLKLHNYHMKPIRKSNGYSKSGKKLYLRYFEIERINNKCESNDKNNLEIINY